jgi:carbamoyl-phosphate synthase large subunit
MKTVLVSGASGILGYGILRSLKKSGLNLRLVGTTIYEDSVAQGFCDKFVLAPRTSDGGYTDWLCETIRAEDVDLLIPGVELDVAQWSRDREAIIRCGATPVLNRHEVIELCRDKWLFYVHARSVLGPNAIDTSLSRDFTELKQSFGLPFLAKPREGTASRGIVEITSEESFAAIMDRVGTHFMLQPVVGSDDQEYTVAAFCDGAGGYAARMALKRKLSRVGYTEKAETTPHEEFDPIVARLCKHLRPLGPTNFQFRRHNGEFKLLEINPRISSATSIRCAFGYNEAMMAVAFYQEGKLPDQPAIREGRAVRYPEDFIFYS